MYQKIVTQTFLPTDADGLPIVAYPAEVVDAGGSVLGEAADKHDYVEIWNNSKVNKRIGRLYLYSGDLVFRLVSRQFGCCKSSLTFGCGGSTTSGTSALLDDLVLTVDGPGANDPIAGTNTLTLPASYVGRRIRIFRNGVIFHNYTRTSTGISLTASGDVWLNDGPNFIEKITIVNY